MTRADLLLYIRALLSLALSPRKKKPREIKTVFVLQNMKFGDMIATTPVFRALKQHIPGVRVIVGGDAVNKDTVLHNPDIDRYVVFKSTEISRVLRELTNESIDVGLTPGPDPQGLATLALLGAKLIVTPTVLNGWSSTDTRINKLMKFFVATRPHRIGNYAPREYLTLLEPLGIFEENTKKYVYTTPEARRKVESLLNGEGVDSKKEFVVGISPSAGHKIKCWLPERFAEVADYLAQKYQARLIVIGSKHDREEVEAMLSHVRPSTPVVNTLAKLSIDELKALFEHFSLFVSVDTGPIFIAESFGIPTVDIAGAIDINEMAPRGEKHVVIESPKPRTIQILTLNARVYDKSDALRQIQSITTSMVTGGIDELIHRLKLYPKGN